MIADNAGVFKEEGMGQIDVELLDLYVARTKEKAMPTTISAEERQRAKEKAMAEASLKIKVEVDNADLMARITNEAYAGYYSQRHRYPPRLIFELAARNALLKAIVSEWEGGHCRWEEALQAAVCLLADQNAELTATIEAWRDLRQRNENQAATIERDRLEIEALRKERQELIAFKRQMEEDIDDEDQLEVESFPGEFDQIRERCRSLERVAKEQGLIITAGGTVRLGAGAKVGLIQADAGSTVYVEQGVELDSMTVMDNARVGRAIPGGSCNCPDGTHRLGCHLAEYAFGLSMENPDRLEQPLIHYCHQSVRNAGGSAEKRCACGQRYFNTVTASVIEKVNCPICLRNLELGSYCICDDLPPGSIHHEHCPAYVSPAEVDREQIAVAARRASRNPGHCGPDGHFKNPGSDACWCGALLYDNNVIDLRRSPGPVTVRNGETVAISGALELKNEPAEQVENPLNKSAARLRQFAWEPGE
jgi:hypothetical protein